MLTNKWGLVFVTMLVAAAIGLFAFFSTRVKVPEVFAGSSQQKQETGKSLVPDWLYEDMRSRFSETARERVKKERITVAQVHMIHPTSEAESPPAFAAYLSLDRLNGVFVLYAKKGGAYQAIYQKDEPVYGLQVIGSGEYLVVTSGLGGTGVQENKLYVIRHTPEGYKEVWSGIAHSHQARETTDVVDGNVQFDLTNDELVYFQLKRSLKSTGETLMEKSSYDVLRYNEKTMRFEK